MTVTFMQQTLVPRAWRVVGHYFRVLALVSILTVLSSLIRGNGINVDVTFTLFFWLGTGLLMGRANARRVAIGFCVFALAGSLAMMVAIRTLPKHGFSGIAETGDTPLFSLVQALGITTVLLPPLLLLLKPSLLRELPPDPANSVEPQRWTAERFRGYLLGGLFAGQELMTGKTTLERSCIGRTIGSNHWVMSVVTEVREKGNPAPLFISSWVLGDGNTMGNVVSSSPVMTFGSITVTAPDHRAGRYVRFLEHPVEPVDQPNILLVKSDGTILKVRRRLTLANQSSFEKALSSAADLDAVKALLEQSPP
jgi:hypothetical protein